MLQYGAIVEIFKLYVLLCKNKKPYSVKQFDYICNNNKPILYCSSVLIIKKLQYLTVIVNVSKLHQSRKLPDIPSKLRSDMDISR